MIFDQLSKMVPQQPSESLLVFFLKEDPHDLLRFFFNRLYHRSLSESISHEAEGILNDIQLEHSGLVEEEELAHF